MIRKCATNSRGVHRSHGGGGNRGPKGRGSPCPFSAPATLPLHWHLLTQSRGSVATCQHGGTITRYKARSNTQCLRGALTVGGGGEGHASRGCVILIQCSNSRRSRACTGTRCLPVHTPVQHRGRRRGAGPSTISTCSRCQHAANGRGRRGLCRGRGTCHRRHHTHTLGKAGFQKRPGHGGAAASANLCVGRTTHAPPPQCRTWPRSSRGCRRRRLASMGPLGGNRSGCRRGGPTQARGGSAFPPWLPMGFFDPQLPHPSATLVGHHLPPLLHGTT